MIKVCWLISGHGITVIEEAEDETDIVGPADVPTHDAKQAHHGPNGEYPCFPVQPTGPHVPLVLENLESGVVVQVDGFYASMSLICDRFRHLSTSICVTINVMALSLCTVCIVVMQDVCLQMVLMLL